MKKIAPLIFLLIFSSKSFSMAEADFDTLISEIQNKNFEPVELFLRENEKNSAKDPEYFVVLLNYVITKGENKQIVIASGEPAEGDFALRNPETDEVEGFMGERVSYDKELILSGIRKTQEALKYFPDRLDIHFGIIAISERISEWQTVGDQIIAMLQTSKEIDNHWRWGEINSMQGEPKEFMIQNILPRTSAFFRLDSEVGDVQLERVSKSLIQHYPNSIYGYANLGTLYMLKKDFEKSEDYFMKALSIDKNDEIVLSNLQRLKGLKSR